MMNAFRLAGDLSHLIATIILLFKIWRARTRKGIFVVEKCIKNGETKPSSHFDEELLSNEKLLSNEEPSSNEKPSSNEVIIEVKREAKSDGSQLYYLPTQTVFDPSADGLQDGSSSTLQNLCVSETPVFKNESCFLLPSRDVMKESLVTSDHLEIASKTSSIENVPEINNVSKPSIALEGTIFHIYSISGISGKSQILFALVYTTRYLDLFSYSISLYNSAMKVFFIGASYAALYMLYIKFKANYDRKHDTFHIEFLVIPAIVFAFAFNHDFSPLEVLWTFSIYLESVAILPQMYMIFKTGKADVIILYYLFYLGSYRALYILNWVYRYYAEGFYDLIAITAGVVQTVLYFAFFFLYVGKVIKDKVLKLPA